MKILVIPDVQAKEVVDLSHLTACGKYIVDKQPEVIVCIGDFFDFPSLSSYDKGKLSFEGRRLLQDIQVGREAMELLLGPLKALQSSQRASKRRVYQPRMVFTLGNHEARLIRFVKDNPEFDGFISYELLGLEDDGWKVHDFLQPVEIEGIFFSHYFANPFSGKPYSGTATNILKLLGRSFVQGHKQTLDVAVRPTIDGKMQLGVIAGAFYSHEEDYKGYQGNSHWRGMFMLHDVKDGYGDLCLIGIDYLKEKYGV